MVLLFIALTGLTALFLAAMAINHKDYGCVMGVNFSVEGEV